MKIKNYINYLTLLTAFFVSSTSYAGSISPTDTTSDIVNLRQDCSGVNADVKNCATTFAELLDWVWNTRKPSAASPLLIDVGPGDFDSFFCNNRTGTTYDTGFVTVRGSGPNNSAIHNTTKRHAVITSNCTNITFQDISIIADIDNSDPTVAGIQWIGGGTSVWSNVQVKTTSTSPVTYGWYDVAGVSAIDCEGVHYWFGSKISVAARAGSFGYKSNCGETWFYGGDIEVYIDNDTPTSGAAMSAVQVGDDVRIFGSTVRAVFDPNTTNVALDISMTGVSVARTGTFHMHGGIINVDASRATSSLDVTGVSAAPAPTGTTDTNALHTPMTAFRLSAGGNGNVIRVSGDSVESPYTWPKSTTPPSITSTTGSDTFVETDCDSSGNCNDSASTEKHPHLMIYDASCTTNGTWFDVVTNACRQ